ncbi:MAG TPA: class II aldolase/adducin family protein, partial [Vicinamibacteria bacterium]|nr:class II aldolase/adducin family protein [Vicinamibacteria bacterium]
MAVLSEVAPLLAATGRALHARGWALGTSGNFSAVVRREPLVLAISRSGVDKGDLSARDILEVDADGVALESDSRPSEETVVHLAVVRERGAGAVLHTHSVWSTILSEAAADAGEPVLCGYEMLKGLSGVRTHEYTERLPVVENT